MSRKLPDILTLKEQETLLNQFNLRYITPQRNKTIILLLLDTGIRLSEMINLKWENINLITGQLKIIQGKGNKDRIIYTSNRSLEALKLWRERQLNEWGNTKLVFTSRTLNKLDGKAVRKMIKTYSTKAGITKNVTTHTFRHTFASDLLRETNNLRIVQKALGHSNISTTQIYTHIVDKELEYAMKSLRNH